MKLPMFKDDSQNFMLLQNKWSSILNTVLGKPLSSANILTDVQLNTGVNVINHLLGRKMQGWIISDINASAILYRSQPFNDKTLTLTTNSDCVITLVVF